MSSRLSPFFIRVVGRICLEEFRASRLTTSPGPESSSSKMLWSIKLGNCSNRGEHLSSSLKARGTSESWQKGAVLSWLPSHSNRETQKVESDQEAAGQQHGKGSEAMDEKVTGSPCSSAADLARLAEGSGFGCSGDGLCVWLLLKTPARAM